MVVDNASNDETCAVVEASRVSLPWPVQLVQTGVNLGFGRGVNRGVAFLPTGNSPETQEYVCVLNPDVIVADGSLDVLAAFLDAHRRVALVGPVVRNPDATIYPSLRSFPSPLVALGHAFLGPLWPTNALSRRYRTTNPASPDWVSGTAMMIRRDAFDQASGFDERYFMYVEDLDLCWRLRAEGWQIGFCEGAEVTHEIGGSSSGSPRTLLVEHHRSAWQFAKTTSTGTKRWLLPFYGLAIVARLGLVMVRSFVRR